MKDSCQLFRAREVRYTKAACPSNFIMSDDDISLKPKQVG